MKLLQVPFFKRIVKKLDKKQLLDLEKALHKISRDPTLGEQKKGLLAGMYVFKFSMNGQPSLLAYKRESDALILYLVGSHENFYRVLERHMHSS